MDSKERTKERLERLEKVLEKRQLDIDIVMENVHDPHNISAAVRSCDATGIMNVHTVYHSYQKKPTLGNKSSASARKWVEHYNYDSIDSCYSKLRSEGKKIYTTNLSKDAVSLYEMDLTQPIALVFGNEHYGVSDEASEKADGNFIIPQVGMIQSLNISVAVAVTVYESLRQRMKQGLFETMQLSEEEYKLILEKWKQK